MERLGPFQEAALERVLAAWNIPGPDPHHHQREKDRLARNWPALYMAMTKFASAMAMRERNRQDMIDSILPHADSPEHAAELADVILNLASARGQHMRSERELAEAEAAITRSKSERQHQDS